MLMSVILVHDSGAPFALPGAVGLGRVHVEQLSLIDVERGGYVAGPSLDDLIVAHGLRVEDQILVRETILQVVHELALGTVVTLVQHVGDQEVRDPDFVVVGQGEEGIGDLHFIDNLGVCDVPG